MNSINRRKFIIRAAQVPFVVWFADFAWGQGGSPPPRIRYDATSSNGKQMLEIYASAVAKMKATSEGDPMSWVFQWYTHAVRDDTDIQSELNRIYPDPNDPNRTIAASVWNTCQAHSANGLPQNEDFFLPWHRMYVYYFERIIRSVSGEDSFTLPYWNYSTTDSALRGILPPEFRKQDDPKYGALYVDNRNPGVNAGNPIDQNVPGNILGLDALKKGNYSDQGADSGFNSTLDGGLHGNVHVQVGDTRNMGQVPWAANDPIFWMHHCNIDRIWASWNRAGRKNPGGGWLNQIFSFADETRKLATRKIGDFDDIANQGYTYDNFEPAPAATDTTVSNIMMTTNVAGAASSMIPELELPKGPVALSNQAVKVTLVRPGETKQSTFSMLENVPIGPKRLYLLVSGLEAHAAPGILYQLYLDLPEGADTSKADDYRIGTIHFFDAMGHVHQHGNMQHKGKTFSFDITDLSRNLKAKEQLKAKTTITIVPIGKAPDGAMPMVGSITLVEQ